MKRARTLPKALDGGEEWSGWLECDLGFPLVNYCRDGGESECAYLTERELTMPACTRVDIGRTRMVSARARLREKLLTHTACEPRKRRRQLYQAARA